MESMLLWGMILIGVGLLLGALELFIPSHGVLALSAFASAIAGVVLLFVHDRMWGVTGLLTVIVLAPVCVYWGFKLFEYTPAGKALMGTEHEHYEEERREAEQAFQDERRALVGLEGVALSSMHPVGEIRVGQKKYDAIADGSIVEAGQRVRVIRADGLEIVVRPVA